MITRGYVKKPQEAFELIKTDKAETECIDNFQQLPQRRIQLSDMKNLVGPNLTDFFHMHLKRWQSITEGSSHER